MNSRTARNLSSAVAAAAVFGAGTALSAGYTGHPHPQPIDGTPEEPGPDWTHELVNDGKTSIYQTPTAIFPQSEPFKTSEPTNLLPTLYEPMRDSGGDVVPNSLPSTAADPYNLHPDPTVTEIDDRSPRWDLNMIINELKTTVSNGDLTATNQQFFANGEGVPADPRRGRLEREGAEAGNMELLTGQIDYDQVQFAIDILEGNSIDRTYSGMALLHYKGPEMVKKVDPETNTVTVHQSWQRSRIMSDTMFIDPSTIPDDETWTIRYVVDCLFWGHEDFAPFGVFFDDPQDSGVPARPFFQMDQSFFPMEQGKRYEFEVEMPPHRYFNLIYNWGWRIHPPRIQAVEKATKRPGGKNIVKWESDVFGESPSATEESKLAAISMLSDLAPAKRMWLAFREIMATRDGSSNASVKTLVKEIEGAFDDWKNRHELPRGVDPGEGDYDQTIVYLNNSMYGGIHDVVTEAEQVWPDWQTRGETLKVKLLNGDYFPHFYMNVDFGGRRGWENIYQHTIPLGGQGPWFTFGRTHWWQNLGSGSSPRPAMVPAAEWRDDLTPASSSAPQRSVPALAPERPTTATYMHHPSDGKDQDVALVRSKIGLGKHDVHIEYRFDPSQRLRFYQFDPMHHNENILSIH